MADMTTMMIQHKIPDSPEIRLLRQDNLAFYAEINTRAFSGVTMSEVPIGAYLRAIDEVKADIVAVSPEQDCSKEAKYYLDVMLGRYAGYDRRRTEPWIGTDITDNREVVVLLEPAARVLRILRELDSEQGFLAVSSLSSVTERLSQVVARLAGDETGQIEALEARKQEIEAQIATLKARGATPMTPRQRQTEVHALLHDISQIKAGFAEVPAARRRINRENTDFFLEGEGYQGEKLDVFFERTREWEESGESAVLATLRDLHVNIEKGSRIQAGFQAVARECADLLSPHHRREITSFLPDMLEISSDIAVEISGIWKGVHAYISNPNYATRWDEARALRDAYDAAGRVRDHVRPSPRDPRLKDLGLELTLPLRTDPATDLKLTAEPPERPGEGKRNAPVDDGADIGEAREMLAREKARSAYLTEARIRERIQAAMGAGDRVTLSEVLRRFPLRYGRHEITRYLIVAAESHPSLLVEGMSFIVRMDERGITSIASVPNPIFRRTGGIGEGFGVFPTIDYLMHPDELRRSDVGYQPIDRDMRAPFVS